MRISRIPNIMLLGFVGGVLACSDSPAPGPTPVALERVDGDGQSAPVGTAVAQPLRVRVLDAADAGVPDVTVTWAVVSGGGSITPTSTTDDQGIAAATFTLGPVAGANEASASVSSLTGSTVTFTATGEAGPPAVIQLVATVPVATTAPFVHDMFVRDGLAFMFAWDEGVKIYDVGNGRNGGTPANPQLVGSLVTGTSNGGTVSPSVHNGWWFHNPNTGEKKYLFIGQEGPGQLAVSSRGDIHVVDVSNLAQPVEVAFYHHPDVPDAGGTPRTAGVHNFWMDEQAEILYAAYYNAGVVALDVSGTLSGDLSSRLIAEIRPGGAANTFTWGVQLANGSLYAIDMLSGLHQLQLSGNTFTHLSGGGNVPERFSSDLWVHGAYAYTGTWGSRSTASGTASGNVLKVWGLSAGGAPTLVNSVTRAGYATVSDVEVSPDGKWLAYTAEYGDLAGLYLYDLANPASPVFIDRYLVAAAGGGLHTGTIAAINGRTYVFAARDPSPNGPAMLIFDVTDVIP